MPDPIHVVAAVITDARDRVLLARRTAGRDLAGRWEFPGGKREPGETPDAALVRELREELGIEVDVGAAVIDVPQAYPDKRLHLDVRRVTAWRGTPRGREGQALAWVPSDKLVRYAMPPADRPVVAALLQPDRYLVTPEPAGEGGAEPSGADRHWLAGLDAALDAGIRRLQVRLPNLEPARRRRLLSGAVDHARAAGADVLLNGDAALAREFGIGLHLPSAQLRALDDRVVPAGVALAASCHDAADLLHAERIGCDFAVLGPVLPTASHPGAPGIGWPTFARLREQVSLPIYAIGGLGPDDIPAARQHGAQGIAAIRSLWPAG
jgi:8-oxo-dGTP diphosphatase